MCFGFLNIDEWNNIIQTGNIDNYLKTVFNEDEFQKLKRDKLQLLSEEPITFTKNSERFLTFLIENDFNFCIVTNTNKKTVELFKEKIPLLKEIKQWIYRDDYQLSKPDSECYELAKQKYSKKEKYMIGFEDSVIGYNALKHHTDCIYIYGSETIFKNNDCYLLDDYMRRFVLKVQPLIGGGSEDITSGKSTVTRWLGYFSRFCHLQ